MMLIDEKHSSASSCIILFIISVLTHHQSHGHLLSHGYLVNDPQCITMRWDEFNNRVVAPQPLLRLYSVLWQIPTRWLRPLAVYATSTLLTYKPPTDPLADPLTDFSQQQSGLHSITVVNIEAAALRYRQEVVTASAGGVV